MEISPMIIGTSTDNKGDKTYYSYIIVEDGPRLMEHTKEWTPLFKKLMDDFPLIKVLFYNKIYDHYKIVIEGRRDIHINNIKKLISESHGRR